MVALDYSLLARQFFEYMGGWYMHVFFYLQKQLYGCEFSQACLLGQEFLHILLYRQAFGNGGWSWCLTREDLFVEDTNISIELVQEGFLQLRCPNIDQS